MLTANRVEHLAKGVEFHPGDCRYVLKTIADCSIDSIVTDPPYALVSIAKRFKTVSAKDIEVARSNPHRRTSGGFMGKQWDTGETAFSVEFWAECLRVLKPGGHVVAFGGTRTYHRLTCAIEDAGFEVRDQLQWIFASGFPKSHAVDKHIDRQAGAVRPRTKELGVGQCANAWKVENGGQANHWIKDAKDRGEKTVLTANDDPITDAAIQWQGWGTALKPACEPICLARKPLSEGTVAQNVLQHGTGAINVDGCRVGWQDDADKTAGRPVSFAKAHPGFEGKSFAIADRSHRDPTAEQSALGRWPANVLHDGSEEVVAAFPDVHGAGSQRDEPGGGEFKSDNGWGGVGAGLKGFRIGDSGSAARFFYTAKADADDRLGSKHPTVKPVDLMQWLCRLVTPKGGTILDPFAGTGTTGEAAFREGFNAVLIEAEAEYQADIRRRMALVMSGPDERSRESIKAKNLPRDDGPLFAGLTP
jgi:site-specific DNA-methyltransferase (adenine-specific)